LLEERMRCLLQRKLTRGHDVQVCYGA
jgi:hypothetical protein